MCADTRRELKLGFRVRWTLVRVGVIAGTLVLAPGRCVLAQDANPPAQVQPTTPIPEVVSAPVKTAKVPEKQTVRLHHIKVQGDLDTMCIARDIAEQLKTAQQQIQKAGSGELSTGGCIVLELGARRWRADVVSRVVDSIRDCPIRVIALLSDQSGHRIGGGAVAVGLSCERLYIDSLTAFQTSADDDVMDLAPKGTDAAELRLRLVQRLQPLVLRRTADPLIVEAMFAPRTSLWFSSGEDGVRRLTPSTPTEPSITQRNNGIQVVDNDPAGTGFRTRMSSSTLVELGVAQGSVENVGRVLSAENLVASPIVRVRIINRFSAAMREVNQSIRTVDADLDTGESVLKKPLATSAKRQSDSVRIASAVTKADTALAHARRELELIDDRFLEFPELLQTTGSGWSEALTPADKRAVMWRIQLKKRHDRCVKLESKIRQIMPR